MYMFSSKNLQLQTILNVQVGKLVFHSTLVNLCHLSQLFQITLCRFQVCSNKAGFVTNNGTLTEKMVCNQIFTPVATNTGKNENNTVNMINNTTNALDGISLIDGVSVTDIASNGTLVLTNNSTGEQQKVSAQPLLQVLPQSDGNPAEQIYLIRREKNQ